MLTPRLILASVAPQATGGCRYAGRRPPAPDQVRGRLCRPPGIEGLHGIGKSPQAGLAPGPFPSHQSPGSPSPVGRTARSSPNRIAGAAWKPGRLDRGSRFSVKLDRTCRIPPGICGMDVVGNACISARIALTDAGPLLGLAAARLLTIEGAPAKDVLARMTGTCGSLVGAVGNFLHRTDERKLARAINATRRSAGQGTKLFPKLAEGAGRVHQHQKI